MIRQFLIFVFVFFLTFSFQSQNIYTFAGTGNWANNPGDGGLATLAELDMASGIVYDKKGNIIFGSFTTCRLRKVDQNGIITTIAGSGTLSSDNIPATSSSCLRIWGLIIDSIGNLYFGDYNTHRVRKIDTNGIITTIAGINTPTGSFAGDGGLATNARLNYPSDIAIDMYGNIYIVDSGNHRIRVVDKNGIISTFGGSTAGFFGDGGSVVNALFNAPWGIEIDSKNNIYIGDFNNRRIRKVNPSGIINTIAGNGVHASSGDGGLAINASLGGVLGMFADTIGNLFFADKDFGNVRRIDSNGVITRIAGNGTSNIAYSGEGGLATSAQLYNPTDITFDICGNMFITDNRRVFKVCYAASCTCYLDVQDIDFNTELAIFPNPSDNYLRLELNGVNLESSQIEITNMLGERVLSSAYTDKIDVSNLSNGIYNLQIVSPEAIVTKKIVIQH